MYVAEEIQLDDDNRLVVRYDEDNDSPLDWGWEVELHKIEYGYDGWRIHEADGEPLVRLFNGLEERLGSTEKVQRAIHLYQVLTNDTRYVTMVDIGVYRDRYIYMVIADSEEEANSIIDVYTKYLNGEVYIVQHEQRERFESVDNPGTFIDAWNLVDSIGGCYLDDDYTAEVVAREHFDLGGE